jgi:hypothetical protein
MFVSVILVWLACRGHLAERPSFSNDPMVVDGGIALSAFEVRRSGLGAQRGRERDQLFSAFRAVPPLNVKLQLDVVFNGYLSFAVVMLIAVWQLEIVLATWYPIPALKSETTPKPMACSTKSLAEDAFSCPVLDGSKMVVPEPETKSRTEDLKDHKNRRLSGGVQVPQSRLHSVVAEIKDEDKKRWDGCGLMTSVFYRRDPTKLDLAVVVDTVDT